MKKSATDIDKALIYYACFSLGIIPLEKLNQDMVRAMKDISPEEARVFKRKFRKIWRKALKKRLKDNKSTRRAKQLTDSVGVGKKSPSRSEKTARKRIVMDDIAAIIEPMVMNIEKVKPPVT